MRKVSRSIAIVVLSFAVILPATADAQKQKPFPKKRNSAFPKQSEPGKEKKTGSGAAKKRKPTQAEQSLMEKALTEHALSAADVDGMVGKKADLLMNDGKRLDGAKIAKFVKAKDPALIKTVAVEAEAQGGKARSRTIAGKTLFRIEVDKKPYELRHVSSQKAYALIDVDRHSAAVKSQLEANGFKLWEPLTEEKQQRYVEEEKKFLLEVKEHFSQLPMHAKESNYFLFLTDMPQAQIAPYLANLDAMNERLGEAFGFTPGENVWRGKAVIVAFVNQEDFADFEATSMKQAAPENVQGLCHTFENGRVVVSINRGDNPAFFGSVLVHETSHGYMHRYKSNRVVPRWLNEGIADWIAGVTVPESTVVRERQQEAAERLRNTGNLEGLFNGGMPEAWQYGVGSTIVDLLISRDKDAFRLFFDGIKEGLSWEDSLERAYGASKEDLLTLYANAIGVEQLEP
jgi:hypothetical protein